MTNRKTCIVFIFVVLCCMIATSITWAENNGAKYTPGELLIKFKAGVSNDEVKALCARHGAYVADEISSIKVKLIRVPEHALEKVKIALENNPNIEFVEYNFISHGANVPNDVNYSDQWHLPKISAPTGWDICIGSNTIPIAIIDSGIDPTHPDLVAKLIEGYNFVGNNTDTHDVLGHGTAVAGVAAAITNNEEGVAGVAWETTIMPLVVLNSNNDATSFNIARAIEFAADAGIRVINMSLGGLSFSTTEQTAINYAWNKGSIIFACAMNNGINTPHYPAACENVVAVSATNSSDTLASFSNYGDWIDIAAPGTSILTTNRYGGYGSWNGTSFSSPIVAGLAALILSVEPDLTNAQVVDLIEQYADDIGDPGYDINFGHGRVNVCVSLVAAGGTVPDPDVTAPSASITSPETGSIMGGVVTVSVEAADDTEVERVELYVDSVLLGTKTSAPYTFNWDTNNLPEGYYDLSATAYDTSGNTGSSDPVNVYKQPEADITPPAVSFISPADGYVLSKNLKVVVSASDDTGVVGMKLSIDGVVVKVSKRSILRYVLNARKLAAGDHVLSAEAEDAAGNIGVTSITIHK